ncbi:MAG: hypothetical protein MJ252_04320 [archaeon]|nr:hypothetical protein [archaeon]
MKKLFRKLNIKERKAIIFSMCYTVFTFFHFVTVKILDTKIKLSLICFIRISMTVNKLIALKKEDFLPLFKNGFLSFISYAFQMYSIYLLSLTNLSIIIRLFPFLFLLTSNLNDQYVIHNDLRISFFFSLLMFFIILLRNIDGTYILGIFTCLLSIIFKVISCLSWKGSKGVMKDFLLLDIGYLSSGVGLVFIIFLRNQMENISSIAWIFLIFNALTIYYKKIFLLKLLSNNDNIDKIIIYNIAMILLNLVLDVFIFGYTYDGYYLALIVLVINSFFFCQSVLRKLQKKREKELNE